MNYTSQLKGWAIDRVIELAKANGDKPDLDAVMKQATALADYAYVPERDFKDCIAVIVEILKSSPDSLDKVNQLQAELGVIEEDIHRQAAMRNAGKKEIQAAVNGKKGAH